MIVGIHTMQSPGDTRPSHEPSTTTSTASSSTEENRPPPTAVATPPYTTAEAPGVPQMHYGAVVGMPPHQMYVVGQNGGQYHHPQDMNVLASQFQAMGMQQQPPPPPHTQQAAPPRRQSAEAPQSGESETGDDNDGTTETEEEPVKLFVGQVPKKMNEEDIFPTFDSFGPLKDVAIIRDKATGMHRGCAFVTYWSPADAERAQEALHDKFTFPGGRKPAQVKPAEPSGSGFGNPGDSKLFIGMLSQTTEEDEVRELFAPFGDIREIHMIRSADGTSKCAAFLKYVTHESAMRAIEGMNGTHTIEGSSRPLIVKFADNKAQKHQRHLRNMRRMVVMGPPNGGYPPFAPQGPPMGMPPVHHPGGGPQYPMPPPPHFAPGPYGPPGAPHHHHPHPYMYPPQFGHAPPHPYGYERPPPVQGHAHHTRPREGPAGANLFVYHLPHDLTDADLATAFNAFGNVISAKVYVDKYTGESKGFGFVSYDSVISAETAIEHMNGFQIGSKRLKVQHKRVHGTNPNLPPHDTNRQHAELPMEPHDG